MTSYDFILCLHGFIEFYMIVYYFIYFLYDFVGLNIPFPIKPSLEDILQPVSRIAFNCISILLGNQMSSSSQKAIYLPEDNLKKIVSKVKLELKKISKDLKFLKINYGQALIFNQALPHGNRINQELATRWSFNCRFKGLFTPYGDKKLGEFFQPLSIKPATKVGMKYKLPNI